jgi:hypothetical protein
MMLPNIQEGQIVNELYRIQGKMLNNRKVLETDNCKIKDLKQLLNKSQKIEENLNRKLNLKKIIQNLRKLKIKSYNKRKNNNKGDKRYKVISNQWFLILELYKIQNSKNFIKNQLQ